MNILESDSIEKIGIRWGLITFIILSAYFLLMKVFGLVHVVELRFFNALIMFYGCYRAIKSTKENLSIFSYFKGIGAGSLTALVSAGLFTISGFIYIIIIDQGFIQNLMTGEPLGLHLNGYLAVIQILIEGVVSGFIFSFIIMQWLKEPRITSEE